MVRKVIRQVEPVELDVDQMHGQGKLVCVKLSILRGVDEGNEETVQPDPHLPASKSWQGLGLEGAI